MKPVIVLVSVVLAAALFGAGYQTGRRGNSAAADASTRATASDSTGSSQPLPLVTTKKRPAAKSEKAEKSVKRMTLAEIEAALDEIKSLPRDKVWERVNEITKAVDPADIPAVMALTAKLPQQMQSSIRYALLPRWAETDPKAAMEWANGLKNFNDRHQAILSVLRGWAKLDPQAAAAWIQQLPPGRLKNEAPGAIASALAEKDPNAAFDLLKNTRNDRGFGYSSFYQVFDVWAGNDPAAAAAKAGEIKNWQQRQNAYQNIARRWAEKDVQAALA